MNIAFLLRFWPQYGGGESVAIQLSNEFVKRGHNVTIYYLWDNYIGQSFTIDSKIKVRKIPNCHSKVNIYDINRLDYTIMKATLAQGMKEDNTEIVINIWWPTKIVYKARKLVDLTIKIFTCYYMKFSIDLDSPKRKLLKKMMGERFTKFIISKMVYNHFRNDIVYSDKWVLMSDEYINDAKLFVNNKKMLDKIISIPNPVRYEIGADENIIKQKENIILFIGRFMPWKRIDVLLNIWGKIQNKPEMKNWKLQLIGDGPCFHEMQSLAEKLKLHDVEFAGSKEPLQAYQKAKIIVSASEAEGMPQSLIEGMRNGCSAIVVGSYSAVVDIINHGEDGYIIKKGNQKDFENKILELVSNSEKLYRMQKNAVTTSSKFTISNVVTAWEQLILGR